MYDHFIGWEARMKLLTSDEIYPRIEEILTSANTSLKMASAWIKGRYFQEILDLAKERNLSVEVVLRASEFRDFMITDDRVFKKIREVGAKVYLCSRLHAKFMVVDSRWAIVGSANFTESGLSDISGGNIEVAVFYDAQESEDGLRELEDYFERIKSEHSTELGEDLVGFALNPVKTGSFEFILIDDVSEQSYVEVRTEEGRIFGRVTSVFAYDTGFFTNPFTSQEAGVFAPFEDFSRIFAESKDREWKKFAVSAYLNERGNGVRVATADIEGIVIEGRLDMVRRPFEAGSGVYRASEDTLESLMKNNSSGKAMSFPVRVGTLDGSEVEVFLDAGEVVGKHMLIVGTTGSGKSHFTKLFLSRLLKAGDVQVFIFDPHGEYYDPLSEFLGDGDVEHVIFEDTIFPVYGEELIGLIKNSGHASLVRGNTKDGAVNLSLISRAIRPSLALTELGSSDLLEIVGGLKATDEELENLKEDLRSILGEGVLTNQPETVRKIEDAIRSSSKAVVLDFKRITDPQTRVNIAGLIMDELFRDAKHEQRKRLIVLEEAHNFAPERGYGDVSAGGDNLSLLMAKKIASEGRKFSLGLVVVTQRPAQVSKYVLSQTNTQAMFRMMNSQDLDAISNYVEYAGKNIIGLLPSLPTGTGVLSGLGVPFTVVVRVDSDLALS